MSHLLRMLNGAGLGALLGFAVGVIVAAIVLSLDIPSELPVDRWPTGIGIFVLLTGSGTVVGLVVGLASKVLKHGLSLIESTVIVAMCGFVAIVLSPCGPCLAGHRLLAAFLVGIIFGGIAVVGVGALRTRTMRIAKQESRNPAGKV
jgi:hypothetical protein